MLRALFASLMLLMVATPVWADHVNPTCTVPSASAIEIAAGYYLHVLDVGGGFVFQLWKESNHIPKLQWRDHLCPDGSLYLKDTRLASCDTTRPTSEEACLGVLWPCVAAALDVTAVPPGPTQPAVDCLTGLPNYLPTPP